MKICILGKYPPIQGGVSAQTYWLARGLAERGHRVFVVTNANEVESRYRISLDFDRDAHWYSPSFPNGGAVEVICPESINSERMSHIPFGNPFVTKIASVATDVVRREKIDAIYAYYYEPYAVSGWLTSQWTGVPLIVKHAGSDLDRLMKVPDMATTYLEVLRSANTVLTWPGLAQRFLSMGVRPERLGFLTPYSVPTSTFNVGGPVMDIAHESIPISGASLASAQVPIDSDQYPIIGMYGKIGVYKGTYDLIKALGILRKNGVRFRLAAMIGELQGAQLVKHIIDAGFIADTYILPFLPNWRVPEFIRACSGVCFLERDFPVSIHGPIQPREILACGTPLVLSQEIAVKQGSDDTLSKIATIVDPKNHSSLATALRRILESGPATKELAIAGAKYSSSIEDHAKYVEGWESLFFRVIRGEPSIAIANPMGALLGDSVQGLLKELGQGVDDVPKELQPESYLDAAVDLLSALQIRIEDTGLSQRLRTKVQQVLRYRQAQLRALQQRAKFGHPFMAAEFAEIGDAFKDDDLLDQLVPNQSRWSLLEKLEIDVSKAVIALRGGLAALDAVDVGHSKTSLLFVASASCSVSVHKVGDAVEDVLLACDGQRTLREVQLASVQKLRYKKVPDGVAASVSQALVHLHGMRAIGLAKRLPSGTWLGGPR